MAKTLLSTQLGFYFNVGPAGAANEALCADRQSQSYAALTALFQKKAMELFGRTDQRAAAEGDVVTFLPIELCECDWDPEDSGDKVVYSVWFHSSSPLSLDDAKKLLALAEEAYAIGCGEDASYVCAESYSEWKVTERVPYDFPVKLKPTN